jgi:hypothetical protein
VIEAARNPCRQREIYGLWEGLAVWSRYGYAAERVPNPLLESVAMPSASLCEYAYAAVQVDIVPGASNHQTCPELLWATFLRWQESLAPAVERIATFNVVRDEQGLAPTPLPMEIKV